MCRPRRVIYKISDLCGHGGAKKFFQCKNFPKTRKAKNLSRGSPSGQFQLLKIKNFRNVGFFQKSVLKFWGIWACSDFFPSPGCKLTKKLEKNLSPGTSKFRSFPGKVAITFSNAEISQHVSGTFCGFCDTFFKKNIFWAIRPSGPPDGGQPTHFFECRHVFKTFFPTKFNTRISCSRYISFCNSKRFAHRPVNTFETFFQ